MEDRINGISIEDAGNYIYNANLVTLDDNGDATIIGNTDGDDVNDWYKFTTNSDGVTTIDLTGISSDMDLYLYDSNRSLINYSYSGGTEDEHISQTLDANSTYYVRVTQYGNDSDYTLNIDAPGTNTNDNSNDDEYNNNSNDGDIINGISIEDAGNYIYNANLVTLDDNGDATIIGNTDGDDVNDWYKFTTNSDGVTTIDLTGISSDMDLYLYDSNRSLINYSYSGGTEDEHISQTLDANSTYYVRVTQYGNDSDYTLNIDAPGTNTNDNSNDDEYNNNSNDGDIINGISIEDAGNYIYNANLVTLDDNGDATIIGNTDGDDVNDWYKFTTNSDGVTTIDLTGISSDMDLYLYDFNRSLINYSYSGGTEDEHISQTLDANSTYYVRVTQFGEDSDYTLNIDTPDINSSGDDSYSNDISDGDQINGVSIEDAGNYIYNANLVTLDDNGDATIIGNTDGDDVNDWYKFTTNSDGVTTIDLTGISSDMDLYLYDSNRSLINYSYSGGTEDEHISQTLDANSTYYVRVTQYGNDSDYTLNIDAPGTNTNDNSNDDEYNDDNDNLTDFYNEDVVNTLDTGYKWDKDVITYSFNETIPSEYYADYEYTNNWQTFDSNDREIAREAMDKIEEITSLKFEEVESGGDIRFNKVDMNDANGFATYPTSESDPLAGDVWLSNNYDENEEYGYLTMLHEIGHALGLKHPFEGDETLPEEQDNLSHTIMTYNNDHSKTIDFYVNKIDDSRYEYGYSVEENAVPDDYQLYDAETLISLYGANTTTNNDDTVYNLSDLYNNHNYYTIWDTGGFDTIDLSDATYDSNIDMRDGTLSSVDYHSIEDQEALTKEYFHSQNIYSADDWIHDSYAQYETNLYTGENNLAIMEGVVIENLVSGSGDDTIYDNSVSNTIFAGAGDDTIYLSGEGSDIVDGGIGNDTVYLLEKESLDIILDLSDDSDITTISDLNGAEIAQLTGVEHLVLSDTTISL